MTFFFGPNIIGTQSNSVAPKIVPWSSFTSAASIIGGSVGTSTAVTEGQTAWAAFKFVEPISGTGASNAIQQMDSVKLAFSMSGASPSDYVNNGQLYVWALTNVGGTVGVPIKLPVGNTTTTSYSDVNTNNFTLSDSALDPVNSGTGVYGFLLATPVKADNVVENGDRVLFQVTTSDHTKFTDSAYVEKYVDIQDIYPATTLPKVVVSEHPGWNNNAYFPNAGDVLYPAGTANTQVALMNSTPGSSVQEGQWAYATFWVTDGTGAEWSSSVKFDTNIKASFSGASPSDYVANSFRVTAWTSTGGFYLPQDNLDGTYKLTAGTTHIAMGVKTAKDALVESGEEVLFQLGKVDVNAFDGTDYLEKKIQILDTVHKWDVAGASDGFGQTPNVQDNFVIADGASKVSNGTSTHSESPSSNTYSSINGLADGDFLTFDVVSPPSGLHLANWGVLPTATVPNEVALIQGLRQLSGVQCAQGGVYVMQVQNDTYVLFDSDNSGTLVMNSSTNADIFVKLAGVAASTIQSTDFAFV